MDIQDLPIKHGYLTTHHTQILLKRTWQRKYCALYGASSYAVQRAELFESEEAFARNASSSKLIPLNDCVKVVQTVQKSQPNVFEVTTKSQLLQFSTSTTQELAEWVQAFQTVAFGVPRKETCHPNISCDSITSTEEQEENQIYCSVTTVPDVVFPVKVVDTLASEACGLRGQYLLVVGPYHLSLKEEHPAGSANQKPLYIWQYHHIRRYGRTADVYTFEAGRMCRSGEGTFKFETPNANSLFHSAQARMSALKAGDVAKFSANIHLEAAPILKPQAAPFAKPPRKTKGTVSQDSEVVSTPESHHQSKAKLPLSDLLSNSLHEKSVLQAPVLLPKQLDEPVYAALETRQAAWKTFALETDNIHVESIREPRGDYDYLVSPVTTSPVSPSSSSVFLLRGRSTSDSSKSAVVAHPKANAKNNNGYDYLMQFAPQTSEIAHDDNHIYHRLISSSSSSCTSPSFIEPEDLPPAIGASVPEPVTAKTPERTIDHISQNDQVYAVVSKPLKLPQKVTTLDF